MWSFWSTRSLAYCESWMESYAADQSATAGGGSVVSISGGGESETRGDYGVAFTMMNLKCCRRRMSQLDPTKYPPLQTRQKPNFSSLTY
jgi:hypothetical protein